jgi:hypothetical protein
MNWLRNFAMIWMVATTVHAPFPVCDGDNLASGQTASLHFEVLNHSFDLDFILLGCDLPDDYDDGPLDVDPEEGSSSAFGSPYTSPGQPLKLCLWNSFDAWGTLFCMPPERSIACLARTADRSSCLPFLNFSFGKLSQSGNAHFHC